MGEEKKRKKKETIAGLDVREKMKNNHGHERKREIERER